MNKMLTLIVLTGVLIATGFYYNIRSADDIRKEVRGHEGVFSTGIITIGTVSDDAVKQITTFQPTADYIAARLSTNETRYEGKVVIVKSVDNISDLFNDKKLDLYFDTPFAAIMAAKKSGAVPFLRRWKDGLSEYHSVFIVKNDSPIRTISDLKGKIISFEDPGSTSAYFLPKAYLMQRGFNLSESREGNNIGYVFSGDDENTPLWVIEGKADAGTISNLNYDGLHDPVKEKIREIERTPDVPRFLVSYRSDMDPALVEKIKLILLGMDGDQQGIEILKKFKTKKYDAISYNDESLINISKMIELIE